jgi:TolB protein
MLTLLLATLSAFAQGIVIEVPGSADVPLAAPRPQLPAGVPVKEAEQVYDALWTDLDQSGYFRLQDPAGYLEKGKGVEPGTFDFQPWITIKASVLVKTRVLPAGHADCGSDDKICADVYAYYVPTGEELLSTRFRGPSSSARHLGHGIANAVLEATTGVAGIFGARLAAVGSQNGNKEIYLLDLDGYGVTPVTRNGAINLSPAWSPGGGSIAWTSYKKANPDLYVKDLGTGRTRVVSNVRGVNTSPAFSPDGSRIALARSEGGDADIFEVNARTGELVRQVTRGGGIDVSPVYLPDGSGMLFASERGGGSQIYLQRGSDVKRVSFVGDFNIDPVVSPDGTQVAWVGRAQGGFDIFVADIDGTGAIRITQDTGDNEDPTWSPDGRYLVFSSTRTGRSELWISTADGRHQKQITRTGGWTQPTFRW